MYRCLTQKALVQITLAARHKVARNFFITASGTGIGKTLVTTGLNWQLRQAGQRVTALKPVASGYDPHDPNSDTALILKSSDLDDSLAASITPWRFSAPLSPNLAAELEGKTVLFAELVKFCRNAVESHSYTLVEGVGGVMAPLDDSHTVIDWIAALGWPVICVGGSYLGAMSHTLTAIETLRAKKIAVHAVIISESDTDEVTLTDTIATLKKFLPSGLPIYPLPRIYPSKESWRQLPAMAQILDQPIPTNTAF